MALKKYEIIRPKSLTDSNYEEYEYLIRWIGTDGAEYLYMFYDIELDIRVRGEIINERDENKIETLIDRESRTITLKATDLTRNEFDVITQLFKNKYVTRILKDGTIERYAPKGNRGKKRLMDYRYDIEFEIMPYELPIWK